MAIIDVSARHIAPAGSSVAFEPQRTNNFRIRVSPPGNVAANGRELLQFATHSVQFPTENSTEIDIPYGNETRKVAGRVTYPNIALVFKDFVDKKVLEILVAWRKLVYDPVTGKIGYAWQYKRNGDCDKFGPDGDQFVRRWRLLGMWPSSLDPGVAGQDNVAQTLINVTFTVDQVRYIGRV